MYLLISIIILFIILIVLIFIGKKKQKTLSPLASLAFAFIVAGIIFGENRIISYLLIGIGIFLAVIDIAKKGGKENGKKDSEKDCD